MAKKKNKTGLFVLLIICGIVIGVIATIIVMTLLDKKDVAVKETQPQAVQETLAETGQEEETFDDSTPDDPIPTDEMNIAVIKVNDSEVTMKEINVYLYQLRDFIQPSMANHRGIRRWRMEESFMSMRRMSCITVWFGRRF